MMSGQSSDGIDHLDRLRHCQWFNERPSGTVKIGCPWNLIHFALTRPQLDDSMGIAIAVHRKD